METGKTVSLALGSGGARGLAHIGIIEWLDEHGFQIQSIAGASMGALVGGIYAAGALDTYKQWVLALERRDVLRLLDLSYGWSGLFKGDRVIETLRKLIGECNIEDLDISYTAVATDVERQKEVWLTKGPLFDAIRASIAVPLVFTPGELRGRRLLDGGLINPLPIAPTLVDHTDLTIAVNLSGHSDPQRGKTERRRESKTESSPGKRYHQRIQAFIEELQGRLVKHDDTQWGLFDVLAGSFDTMQNTIARLKLAAYSPDVTITISRDSAASYEFHRAKELIALGRDEAEHSLSHLLSGQAPNV